MFVYNGCGCDTGSCIVCDGCRLCEECCSCSGLIGSDIGGSQFRCCSGRGEEVDKLFCCECVLVAVSFVVVAAEVMKLMNYSVGVCMGCC